MDERELAVALLEKDIGYLARKYHVPGYDFDDLCQEMRLQICRKIHRYNPELSTFRTWGNAVMRNRIFDLLKKRSVEANLFCELRVTDKPTDAIDTIFDYVDENEVDIWEYL